MLPLVSTAFAAVSIEWVTVGDAGNEADPLTGFGAVDSEFLISKYPVTYAQYTEFLNAKARSDPHGLFGSPSGGILRSGVAGAYTYSVTSGQENQPVAWVSWFRAARFANWLHNGQGDGDTETGAYTLNGATRGIFEVNPGATIFLPSEDQWYKAAYYNGETQSYSLFPNGKDTITTAEANFDNPWGGRVDVDHFPDTTSYYGTLDQAGNVSELTDGVIGNDRALWGGAFHIGEEYMRSTSEDVRRAYPATGVTSTVGFRLAAVPEPGTSMVALLLGGTCMLRRRRG